MIPQRTAGQNFKSAVAGQVAGRVALAASNARNLNTGTPVRQLTNVLGR